MILFPSSQVEVGQGRDLRGYGPPRPPEIERMGAEDDFKLKTSFRMKDSIYLRSRTVVLIASQPTLVFSAHIM